ncbi:PTS glucose transporter subunit IIA [Pseudoalteromonas sp. MMG010]|uniref:PTS glucose transporter subunit IIA n=1 Tax=Pseudoalteromonas sp. MMG010 TaxID=2822685 RepID=UPI001B3A2CBE|nr:PTS glucose transporter subunit IIA [Pseudoalteromonas sp. MMG010]MBQ4832566.1 PTS glucose transporter subunit IIA [Pseudoalteromonas sp. MMG010]
MNALQVTYKAQNTLPLNSLNIASPFTGKVLSIDTHPVAFFRYSTLGPSVLVELSSHKILAPFNGKLLQVKNAGTEFVLQADNGIKLLLNLHIIAKKPLSHTRITQLNGKNITHSQQLAYFDLLELESPILASVVLLNGHNLGRFHFSHTHVNAGIDPILSIIKKI